MDIKTIITRAGGPAAVGAIFGITSQAVSQWTRVPVDRCMALSRATGIPVEEMLPDEESQERVAHPTDSEAA